MPSSQTTDIDRQVEIEADKPIDHQSGIVGDKPIGSCEKKRKGQFLSTKEASVELHMSVREMRKKHLKVPEGSVWRRCRKGIYHVAQVNILVLLTTSKITLKVAELRWELFKENLDYANRVEVGLVEKKEKKK